MEVIYAKSMEYHGNGMALFHPIAGQDMRPPCCGYFDRNNDWNFITRLRTARERENDDYVPLESAPTKVTDIDIVWQPKTSLGVTALAFDTSVETTTPVVTPINGDAHIKYTTSRDFGAVLMTQKPVRLQAYNNERLFIAWLDANKGKLYEKFGSELKKYGLWIVTRTYNAPGCSINIWNDNASSIIVSLKAKAYMLGELGEELGWQERLRDKDWCHYKATDPRHGLVVFMDGIEVKPADWWLQGVKDTLLSPLSSRGRNSSRAASNPSVRYHVPVPEQLQEQHRAASEQRDRPETLVTDADVLQDAGVYPLGRSPSVRRLSSYTASISSPSLRRENRNIYDGKDEF